ncbi:MAG TPA: hypothetical protein VIQ04_03050, partial [Nitrososphaeraceae archaeon]
HCFNCGERKFSNIYSTDLCPICHSKFHVAGQLWSGKLFDKSIISNLIKNYFSGNFNNDKINHQIKQIFDISIEELDDMPYYFSVDEIASKLKTSPKKLSQIIEKLICSGYRASRTTFRPTGLKTNASMSDLLCILKN